METPKVFTVIIAPLLQIILAFVACIFAWYIPNKLSWEQRYSQLLSDYRGYDFGAAVMGITMFFKRSCDNDINKIEEKEEAAKNREAKRTNQ